MSEESKPKTLTEHTDELRNLLAKCDRFDSEGEEIPAELEVALANALSNQADKIDRCCSFIARAQAELTWLKSEREAIAAQEKRVERAIKRMSELAGMVMASEGTRKLSGNKHCFYKRAVVAADIQNADVLPDTYKTEVSTTKVDKKKVLDHLKQGIQIPGAKLLERDTIISK